MKTLLISLAAALLLAVPFSLPAATGPAGPDSPPALATEDELAADVQAAPCRNKDREAAAQSLLQTMGAASSDIQIAHFKHVDNIVITMPGAGPGKIVIGAHYDKVPPGCGAIDNWTGVVTVAHLYKTLKDVKTNKTILFVLFGMEEEGLVGSAAMTGAIARQDISSYCEMINIDSFGLAAPQVADNMSSPKLEKLAEDDAKSLKCPFGHASIPNADADSSSFVHHHIPAVTLHGLTNDWPRILHSDNDTYRRIKPISLYMGYRLALKMVLDADQQPCDAYR